MKDRIQEMRNMLNVVGSPSVGGPTLGTFHRPAEKLNVDEVSKYGAGLDASAKLGYSLDVAAQAIGADIRNKELSAANVKEILYDLKSMKTQLDSIIKAVGKYPGPVNEGITINEAITPKFKLMITNPIIDETELVAIFVAKGDAIACKSFFETQTKRAGTNRIYSIQ